MLAEQGAGYQCYPKKSRKAFWVPIACVLMALSLTACPPQIPCDEKIEDPEPIKNIVMANPVVQELASELTLIKVENSACFVDNQTGVMLLYELPASFSGFNITYRDYLTLLYSKDGSIEISGYTHPEALEKEAILAYYKQKISEVENNPRVREVITKTKTDPMNPFTTLVGLTYLSRAGNHVEYSFFTSEVHGYLLSNDLDWQEFPEIKRAHDVIEEHLLVGELANCNIGRSNMHSYTSAEFHDSPTGPWFLTVALLCDDGWKDAYVKINHDGSYENLEIRSEYHNK